MGLVEARRCQTFRNLRITRSFAFLRSARLQGFVFGGFVRTIALVLIVAGLLGIVWVSMPNQADAQIFFGPSKMPAKWDARIPVPPRSTLLSSARPNPGHEVYSAEFLAPRSYHETVDFYQTELPKAGFTMGPKTANVSRRLYQQTFTDGTVRDKLTIHTRPGDDRGLLTIHIRYTLPPRAETTSH
jgi:hypothetical protein